MRYECPVCGYSKLPYPARDYHICPCCGTEFGNDDAELSHSQLREMWVAAGARWFFRNAPYGWNPYLQLLAAGLGYSVPQFAAGLFVQSDATPASIAVPIDSEPEAVLV